MVRAALVIPDCHIPWNDAKAFELMLHIANFQNELTPLEQIIILGDFADCFALSLHDKLPSELQLTPPKIKEELEAVFLHLRVLRKLFPKTEIIYLEGNHEQRLTRFIVKNCFNLASVIGSYQELVRFKEIGQITWVPFGRHQLFNILDSGCYARHCPYDAGRNTALGTITKGHINLIYGHTHRVQSASISTPDHKLISAFSFGSLIDINAPIFDYVDRQEWAQGFGFVFALPCDFFIDFIDIKQGQAVYHGTLYR